MRRIKKSAQFLIENGLLFEINRKILHPLGLALEIEINDDGKIDFGDLWDCREDPEGILFTSDAFEVGKEKYAKYLEEKGDSNLKSRIEKLGFTIQEE